MPLTRSMSRHVSFKLEPTALSLKPLPKYTRDLSASFSVPELSHDLGELSNNLEPFLLPCCFNNNNFLLDACRTAENVHTADAYNYLPFYGSNFETRGFHWLLTLLMNHGRDSIQVRGGPALVL